MKKLMVTLNKIEEVNAFTNDMSKLGEDFTVTMVSENWKVNAKSILGILSLDLSKPVEVQITYSGSNPYMVDEATKVIKKYEE